MTRIPRNRPRPPAAVPAWPSYELTANPDGTVTVAGPAAAPGPYGDREAAVAAVAQLAALLHPPRPVRAQACDQDGTVWPLHIAADGTTTEAGPPTVRKGKRKGKGNRQKDVDARAAVPARRRRPASKTVESTLARSPAAAPSTRSAPCSPELRDEPTVKMRCIRRPEDTGQTGVTLPVPGPRTPPRPSVLTIHQLESEGRYDEALDMAKQLDQAATRTHGISHPRALQARELLAHITVRGGDLLNSIALYRDAAERWAMNGEPQAAEDAAGRAHALWLTMKDPVTAIPAGENVVRMRQTVPGTHQDALDAALRRLGQLKRRAAQTR